MEFQIHFACSLAARGTDHWERGKGLLDLRSSTQNMASKASLLAYGRALLESTNIGRMEE